MRFVKFFKTQKGNNNQITSIDVKKKLESTNEKKIQKISSSVTNNPSKSKNNAQFNVILEEFSIINQSLVKEKEYLDKEKFKFKEKHESIQNMIM